MRNNADIIGFFSCIYIYKVFMLELNNQRGYHSETNRTKKKKETGEEHL
jgi:hypothetical protein